MTQKKGHSATRRGFLRLLIMCLGALAAIGAGRPAAAQYSLCGEVDLNVNCNHVPNPNLPGVKGVLIQLYTPAGAFVSSTTTDANGDYCFANLPAGTYSIVEVVPSGYTPDIAYLGVNNCGGTVAASYTMISGIVLKGNCFGYNFQLCPNTPPKPVEICGYVYLNNVGGPPVASVTLTLTNSNGSTVGTTTTNSSGYYCFLNLPPGTYKVTETVPSGYVAVSSNPLAGSGGTSVTPTMISVAATTPGTNYTPNDFVIAKSTPLVGSIAGTVYCDDNFNNVIDAGEGEPNITITLENASGTVLATTSTDANGNYLFSGLSAATYLVVAPTTLPDGCTITSTNPMTVPLSPGQNVTGVNFRYVPCASGQSSINSNFNGTAIISGSNIWFNSVAKVSGLGTSPVTLQVVNQVIKFTANGTTYTLPVPDATITFSPTITQATTTFNTTNNSWVTSLPSSGLAGNIWLSGLSFPVPTTIAGGAVNSITWSGQFLTNTTGVTVQWQWAAAVYSTFSTNYNALGVKPCDDNKASQYQNSDHAGTPENFRQYVVGGARGGGGSNFTGSYSGTGSVTPCVKH